MLCPDIFEYYDKSKEINGDYSNLRLENLNKEVFDSYLVYYTENKNAKRIDKMKKYIEFGFDINHNITKYNYNWIEFAIMHNDIPLIGILIKNNVNLHKVDSNNLNLIFICVLNKNDLLLKYFLNLGVNPNQINKDNQTSLTISCIMDNCFNCAKILLENPLIMTEIPNHEISLVDIIINRISHGDKNYLELLNLLLKKKKKLNSNDMKTLRNNVLDNQLEIVKIFVNNFPDVLNKSSDDEDAETIVHIALHDNLEEMLRYFFTFKGLDWKKKNKEDTNYLEYLCGYQMIELLDLFCKKYPKSLDLIYTNSQGIIESVILTYDYDTIDEEELETIKKIITILISNGANINHKNKSEYTSIFPAIQYTNPNFILFMIGQGASITDPLVRNSEFPPVSNNDPISFAIQLNKFEILKLLIDSKSILHQIDISGIKFYTSILVCLKYKRCEHLQYLIKIPEINKWITGNNLISNYLFDYGIKNGCMDELILKLIAPEFKIKSFDFTDPNCSIGYNEKKISICIDDYKSINNKLVILNGILETTRILSKLSSISHKNYSLFFDNFSNLYESVSESIITDYEIKKIHNNFYDWIDCFIHIICDKIDYYNMHNVKKIFGYVFKLYWEIPDDSDDSDDDSNFNKKSNEFVPKQYTKKINNLYKLFESKKSIFDDYEKEILLIVNKYKYENNNSIGIITNNNKKIMKQDIVIKKLFKLFWPIKQPHYEYMYRSIVHNNDKIINKTNIIVMSENKIKSTIFSNPQSEIPQRWIKTYAPNIGKEEKNDPNHMFSFLLDSLLEKFPCVYVEVKDPNHDGTNLLYYFNGMLEHSGEIETGCYEYFINSNGTLFHRMFRPWIYLSNNIKKLLKN